MTSDVFRSALLVVALSALAACANDPQRYEPGDTFKDCRDCPEMVVVPSGRFRMGDPTGQGASHERPVHSVTFPRPFAVGKFEITVDQFGAFFRDANYSIPTSCDVWKGNGWSSESRRNWMKPVFSQSDLHPVVCVSWNDANAYVSWLRQKTDKDYRLLTEAEWEYVARGGTQTKYPWGDEVGTAQANCDGCGSRWDNRGTAPTGSFPANGFHAYDMLGNVWEWVEDCWTETYVGAPTDGSAWLTGDCDQRVLRGGSWNYLTTEISAAARLRIAPATQRGHFGFRVARTLP